MAQKPSSSQKAGYLNVPNAPTIAQFKIEAEGVWKQAHTPKRRGRPTQMETVCNILNAGLSEEEITPETSLNKLVQFGKKRLGTFPHEETIRKYAKVWKIMQKHPLKRVKAADASWIKENAPDAWSIFEHKRGEEQKRYHSQMGQLEQRIRIIQESISKARAEIKQGVAKVEYFKGKKCVLSPSYLKKRSAGWISYLEYDIKTINKEITALKKWWDGSN